MKQTKYTISTLILALGLLAVPAIQAGDYGHPNRAHSSSSYKNLLHIPIHERLQERCVTRCDRRCSRLMRMVNRRGCICQGVAHVIQPARAHSYLSNHYPPFRYAW